MTIRCDCGAAVVAANVNVAAAIAKCDACGAVFSIAQRPAAPSARVIPASITDLSAQASPSAAPVGYRDGRSTEDARWRVRWFRPHHLFFVFFLIFWNGISFSFVVEGLRGGGMGLLSLLMPHPWIGVALSYWTLAHLFNRSTITLSANELVVANGPIPWRSLRMPRSAISRFDAIRGASTKRQRGSSEVRAIGPDQRAQRVLGGLTEEEADYLAAALDDALRSG